MDKNRRVYANRADQKYFSCQVEGLISNKYVFHNRMDGDSKEQIIGTTQRLDTILNGI